MLQDMLGGGAAAAAAAAARGRRPMSPRDNPFGKIFEEMLGGGGRAPDAQAAARSATMRRSPRANPSGRAKNPYDDIFGKMFETGRKTRDDYQKGVESIFDQFLRGMDNPR